MCVSCGCGSPDDDHGNTANITAQDVRRAAEAADISRAEAAEAADNIHDACCPSAAGHRTQRTDGESRQ